MATKKQINQLYQQTLGRSADSKGLEFYTKKAKDSGLDSVRKSLSNSSEAQQFASRGTARSVSQDDRASGISYRPSSSSSIGSTKLDTPSSSASSSTGQTLPNTSQVSSTSSSSDNSYRDQIQDIYRSELGRSVDSSGLDYYSNLANSEGLDAVRNRISASPEAQQYSSSGNAPYVAEADRADGFEYREKNPDYQARVADIYKQELNRSPDSGGLNFYTQIARRDGLDSVRSKIRGSPERGIYQQTDAPLRVSKGDQVDGFDYRTGDSLVSYDPNNYEGLLGGFFQGGNFSSTTNDQGQTVYRSDAGGQYTFDGTQEPSPIRPDLTDPGSLGVGDREVPTTEVTPGQTVQGQLDQILSSDSPLMQRAATQGAQVANSRGLLNSSMAAGAAQGAMIDRATPIASQDAQTYFQNNQSNADRDMTDYTQRLGFEQGLAQTAQEYGLRSDLLAQEGDQAMEKLYGTSLANAWGVMGNNVTDIVAQTLIEVNDIQTNPNIESEDKTQLIADLLEARDADVEFQAELYSTLPDTLQDTGVFPSNVG